MVCRSVIQARFLPRETIGDITGVVLECLKDELQQTASGDAAALFSLYVSPPKRVLQVCSFGNML